MTPEERQLFSDLINSVNDIKNRIVLLEDKNKISTDLSGLVRILGGELLVGGGVNKDIDETILPLGVVDTPGIVDAKNEIAMGIQTSNKSSKSERMIGLLAVGQIKKETPNDLSGNEPDPNFSSNIPQTAGIYIDHLPYDNSNYFTFVYAIRPPAFASSTGRITNGGTVLTDPNLSLNTNELTGAILFISDDANGGSGEAFVIASNTSNTITITGTFAGSTDEYAYAIRRPVYLGSADNPWRRLYVQDDIRFGYGPSNGANVWFIKHGSGSPENVVTANPGSLYVDTDGGAGTTLYVKESGTGNTGWVNK